MSEGLQRIVVHVPETVVLKSKVVGLIVGRSVVERSDNRTRLKALETSTSTCVMKLLEECVQRAMRAVGTHACTHADEPYLITRTRRSSGM